MIKAEVSALMLAESATFDARWQRWQQREEGKGLQHQVAICGLMNAGKSSLLNMLTGHMEREYFATGASRTTAEVASLTHENIVWLDTPGIDASQHDDDTAWRGILSADTLIFAHTLRTGTLEQIELDFLHQIQQQRPDLSRRLLVVLTHADGAEDQREERLAAISILLGTLFTTPLPLFVTSATRFAKGVKSHKQALTQLSGIPQLLSAVETRVKEAASGLASSRSQDRQQLQCELLAEVNSAIARREQQHAQLKAQHDRLNSAFKTAAKRLMRALQTRVNACKNSQS